MLFELDIDPRVRAAAAAEGVRPPAQLQERASGVLVPTFVKEGTLLVPVSAQDFDAPPPAPSCKLGEERLTRGPGAAP